MERVGLRERKKRDTHRALSRAAQELVHERGLDSVTTDEIAAAADVSARTFFNHFSCKEVAVVGADPAVLAEMAAELRSRPVDERPGEALRAVLVAGVDADGMLRGWRMRNELVRRYPALLPRYLEWIVQVEETLAGALAERLDVDGSKDPTPRVTVAVAVGIVRATLAWWWEHSDRQAPLGEVLDETFTRLMPDLASPR